ncbi:MAG: hypothetical protein J5906_11955 [Acidaminococcaceae bacterium]|nr:hypothetical protein [Acidaminococcaceae bacterium]
MDEKLRKDFGVYVLDSIPSSLENDPVYVLQFPEMDVVNKMCKYLINADNCKSIAIKAHTFAVNNNYAPPGVAVPIIFVIKNNPLTVQIQGIEPIVYFFVYCLHETIH